MKSYFRVFTLCLISTAAIAGCGDSGSPTGLNSNKNLASLTDAERQRLCDYESASAAAPIFRIVY